MDELLVQAEYKPGLDPDTVYRLKSRLESELKAKGLRTIVQMMAPDSLERTQFKARRVIDKRDLYEKAVRRQ
jgi:phenylacetate-coenzyme A ligase PaaK-like adenylate-forming protein